MLNWNALENWQIGTLAWIRRGPWRGKWHASYIMLRNHMFEGKVWRWKKEIGAKLAHPPSFTFILLVLLSRRCRVTDRCVRADTCFWRSLIFKCLSCVNSNTWGNQLAACTWHEWRARPYLPISCLCLCLSCCQDLFLALRVSDTLPCLLTN